MHPLRSGTADVWQRIVLLLGVGPLARDSRGATALEYALVGSMVAVAVAFALTSLDIDIGVAKLARMFDTAVSKV